MRFKSVLTKSLRAEKARLCPRWLRTANSRSADPAQGAFRVMSDLLTAGSKEDEIARTAKSRGRGAALGSTIGRNWTRACAGIHFAAFGFQL